MINIYISTLFPEIFPGILDISLLKKAKEKKIWKLEIINLRNFGEKNRVDDKIFGGLPGMLIRPEVIEKLIDHYMLNLNIKWDKIMYTNPTGRIITQNYLNDIIKEMEGKKQKNENYNFNILIICGRYEGIDSRVIDYYNMEEFSLGEFVLAGGEIPAMALVEGLVRLLPDVLGNNKSLEEESFSIDNFRQYKKYTRPREWKGISVPETLFNGNHKEIEKWKNLPKKI